MMTDQTSSGVCGADLDSFFDCVSAWTDGEDQAQLIAGLKRRLNNPPTHSINSLLKKKLSDEQVRFPRSANLNC